MLAGAGLPELARWVFHVHERFDGEGYPYGLAGREIPMESRILHAADALDQMTRPSAYRRHRPLREALSEISYCSGTRLDAEIAGRVIGMIEGGDLKVSGHEAARPARPKIALDRSRSRPAC
jgi:HD-GYP domain-containing protein (c-di-GMP phosphodiesterase class II)